MNLEPVVLIMALGVAGCGAQASDDATCSHLVERLAALELDGTGRGLPDADRAALSDALALQRGDAWKLSCATWSAAERACLARITTMAEAGACAAALAAVDPSGRPGALDPVAMAPPPLPLPLHPAAAAVVP